MTTSSPRQDYTSLFKRIQDEVTRHVDRGREEGHPVSYGNTLLCAALTCEDPEVAEAIVAVFEEGKLVGEGNERIITAAYLAEHDHPEGVSSADVADAITAGQHVVWWADEGDPDVDTP